MYVQRSKKNKSRRECLPPALSTQLDQARNSELVSGSTRNDLKSTRNSSNGSSPAYTFLLRAGSPLARFLAVPCLDPAAWGQYCRQSGLRAIHHNDNPAYRLWAVCTTELSLVETHRSSASVFYFGLGLEDGGRS